MRRHAVRSVREGQLPALEPDHLQIAHRPAKARAFRPGLRIFLACLTVVAACSNEPAATPCPGQFDPSDLTAAQLRRENIGRFPERGATTRESIRATVAQRRGWIKQNYEGVVDVGIGDGWGVTYTRNELGEITFHREADHIIETTVDGEENCPDPENGTLLIFGADGLRVPVRFVYRAV